MNAWPAALLLLALLPMAALFRASRGRARGRARAVRAGHPMRHLVTGALWRFGLPVPVLLALAGRLPALVTMPPAFRALSTDLGLGGGRDPALVAGMVGGALLGTAAATAASGWAAWRGWRPRYWFGDFAGLEARTRADRGWATILSLVAGVTEEGYFRLLLPLLAALAWPAGGAAAGFAGAALLFAAAHRYQGWRGVATTGLVGLGMTALYLASGRLWLVMAFHVLVDVGSLVVRPWLRRTIGHAAARRRAVTRAGR